MRKLRNSKGFTLIELMIVVVIIGILAALAIPRFTQASGRAKEKEADGILKQMYTLQQTYKADKGTYATSLGSPGLQDVGWEDPSTSLKYYTLPSSYDPSAGIEMTAKTGMTGFCDRKIDKDGNITSTTCH
jgi:prepilin-type N-terminal cleavage/methylation domain-containing protein